MARLLRAFVTPSSPRTVASIIPPETCDEFETDLVLYAYGKIATEQRVSIEAHLDACASCRDRQDSLLQELATAPLDFPPPQFWDDYSREMQQKLAVVDERRPKSLRWRTPFSVRGITAMAAGAILAVTLGISLKDSIFSSGDVPQGDAMTEVFPIVQNLEFFESMHYLEMMNQEADGNIKSSKARKDNTIIIARTRESSRKESIRQPIGPRYLSLLKGAGESFSASRRALLPGTDPVGKTLDKVAFLI